uniref:RRM domain-containing protein n=1 Tax=Eptatretus burgeri TaxID=7764 RepID=A0A8C4QMD5_EPTBU
MELETSNGEEEGKQVVTRTIYLNRLNEKINLNEMRKALFAVFSQFGEILDVVMRKRLKLRGQAFIAFRHQESATNSLRTMYGFPLFGMRMCIQYAKTDADAVTKMKGTFVPRPVTEKPRENPVPKKKVTATHKTPHLASAPGNPIASHVDASTSLMSSHHILFVTNLPDSSSSTMLSMLFSQCVECCFVEVQQQMSLLHKS